MKKITPDICVFDDKEIVWMCVGGGQRGSRYCSRDAFFWEGEETMEGIRKGW